MLWVSSRSTSFDVSNTLEVADDVSEGSGKGIYNAKIAQLCVRTRDSVQKTSKKIYTVLHRIKASEGPDV